MFQYVQDSKIEASIPIFLTNKFSPQLREFGTYKLSRFGVEKNRDEFKIIEHPYKLNFMYGTNVERIEGVVIDTYGFQLVDFVTILEKKIEKETCVGNYYSSILTYTVFTC